MPDTDTNTAVVTTDSAKTVTPTVNIVPLPWWKSLLVRALRASISAFMGFQGISAAFGAGAFNDSSVILGLKAAGGAFVWSALQNGAELLAGIDQSKPGFRG